MISRIAIVSALLCAISPAYAQDASAPQGGTSGEQASDGSSTGLGLDDIVVTARKKAAAERLQDVPIAAAALSGDLVERKQLANLTQVAKISPNVALDELGANKGQAQFSIRGLGTTSSSPMLESPTGVFIDGVYMGSTQGIIFDLFDLDGIEILRGPQGTLFGKNTTAGAVLIHPRAPSKTFEVRGLASIESGPEYKLGLSMSGPLSDTLSARATLYYDKDAGWFHNDYLNRAAGRSTTFLGRASLRWEPSSDVNATVRYEHGRIRSTDTPVQNWSFVNRYSFDMAYDTAGYTNNDWDMVSGELNAKIGPGTLTDVIGYREMNLDAYYDADGTIKPGFNVERRVPMKQFSNELRYNVKVGPVDVTTGLYYFRSHIVQVDGRQLSSLNNGFQFRGFGANQIAETYAAFLQGDWSITDKLILTLGGRYSHDPKRADLAVFNASNPPCDVKALTCAYYTYPNQSHSWNSFTPKVGIQYKFSPDAQVYASWTKAYRAGGYNSSLTSAAQQIRFDQESTSAYEVGFKSDMLDRHLRLNGAFFYNKSKNLIRPVQNAVPGTTAVITDTVNTADATIWGFEGEATVVLTPELQLSGYIGYQHGKYDNVRYDLFDLPGEAAGTINATDYALKLVRLAPWSYGATISYNVPIGDYRLGLRTSYAHRDASFAADNNVAPIRAYNSLDASASIDLMHEKVTLTVYGRNLTNWVYQGYSVGIPSSFTPPTTTSTTISAWPSEGRVVGVEARFKL